MKAVTWPQRQTSVGTVDPVDDVALAARAIGLIDLTDLSDHSDVGSVVTLCERASRHGTAAVCVWPDFVTVARDTLSDTSVRIATVVNFPSGDDRPFAVGVLTDRVLTDGAHEVDVVLPHRAWSAGDHDRAAGVLDAVRARTGGAGALMKVILETGALVDGAAIRSAAEFAIERGADFVKTSTGKIPVSATPEAVEVMIEVIAATDRVVGIKPSGGISSLADAAAYLELCDRVMGAGWARPSTFRFGASGLLGALLSIVGDDAPPADGSADPTTSTY